MADPALTLPRQLDAIRSEGIDVRLMFLEAKVDTLVKRFPKPAGVIHSARTG